MAKSEKRIGWHMGSRVTTRYFFIPITRTGENDGTFFDNFSQAREYIKETGKNLFIFPMSVKYVKKADEYDWDVVEDHAALFASSQVEGMIEAGIEAE